MKKRTNRTITSLLLIFLVSIFTQNQVFTASKDDSNPFKSGSSSIEQSTSTQIVNIDAFEEAKDTHSSNTTEFKFEYFQAKNPRDVEARLRKKGYLNKDRENQNKNIFYFTDFDGVLFPLEGFSENDVDPEFVKLIKKLKKTGIRVAGLTKRPYIPEYSDPCFAAFEKLFGGFDLLPEYSGKLTAGQSIFYPNIGWIGGLFINGVFQVANHNSKGEAIKVLLKTLQEREGLDLSTVTIIFADDFLDFLEDVEAACKEAGVGRYEAFWYRISRYQATENLMGLTSKNSKKTKALPEKAKSSSGFVQMLKSIFS